MVRFGIVGGMNTVVDWGLFFLFNLVYNAFAAEPLVSHPYLYLLANAVAYTAGIANSFLWNKHWTFSAGDSKRGRQEAVAFVLVSLASLVINTLGLQLLRSIFTGTSLATVLVHKLGTTVITMTWNFFGYRFLAFRHTTGGSPAREPGE
jgi:putative flippase GtrA